MLDKLRPIESDNLTQPEVHLQRLRRTILTNDSTTLSTRILEAVQGMKPSANPSPSKPGTRPRKYLHVVSFLLESTISLAHEEFQVEIGSEWDAIQKRIAGLYADGLLPAIFQHRFDL